MPLSSAGAGIASASFSAEQEERCRAKRLCPNCGGGFGPRPDVPAPFPADNLEYREISQGWRNRLSKKYFFPYFRCKSCQLLVAPTYLTSDAMNTLYGEMGDNIHSGDEYSSRMTQYEYCGMAAQHLSTARTYCEIGPDIGLFLEASRKRYALEEVTLIEPNRRSWSQLQQAAAGLKTAIVSLHEEASDTIADNSIDLMVAIHVLDHLLVPSEALQWIKRKLSPRGIAVFVVHNEGSLLAKLMGHTWPPYALQHPQIYNPATLRNTLANQGLQVKAVLRTANQFPLGYLIEHAFFALTKKAYSLGSLSWPVRLKLGNIMAIASL